MKRRGLVPLLLAIGFGVANGIGISWHYLSKLTMIRRGNVGPFFAGRATGEAGEAAVSTTYNTALGTV